MGESDIDLVNRRISLNAARNALLPTVASDRILWRYRAGGTCRIRKSYDRSTAPLDFGGALRTHSTIVLLTIMLDCRSMFLFETVWPSLTSTARSWRRRQSELRMQQLKKQIRIEVRNAQYTLEQSQARVIRLAKAATWRRKLSILPRKSRSSERVRTIKP